MTIVAAMLLSGVTFYLSQGLGNLWVLAWLAPAPLLWLAYGRAPTWILLLSSFIAFAAGQIYNVQSYGNLPIIFVLSNFALQVVLFPFAIWFARYVQRRATPLATIFAFPACWTSLEYLIGLVSPNGSWGSLAYSQMSAPLLIQSASLFGMYSVTFLICLFANTLAMASHKELRSPVALATGLAICALDVAFGFARFAQPQLETLRVAALDNEDAMTTAWRNPSADTSLGGVEAYASAIRAVARDGAKLVVTPEGGLITDAAKRSAALAPLRLSAMETGVQIVAGVVERNPSADLAYTLFPDGRVQDYAKRHPVPFLEIHYIPGQQSGWLGAGRAFEICKDMDFPAMIRADAARGVRVMAVPAGDFVVDAWIHSRMAIMRGVENGFAEVRAAEQGLLTATDAEGRMIAEKTTARHGLNLIVTDLPLGPGPTLYTRIGDAFSWLCLALVAAIGLGAAWQSRKPSET